MENQDSNSSLPLRTYGEVLAEALQALRREIDRRLEGSRAELQHLLDSFSASLPAPPELPPPPPFAIPAELPPSEPPAAAASTGAQPSVGELRDAIVALHEADSQSELMARLVEQATVFSSRAVLLLDRQNGALRAWASLGFGGAGTTLEGLEIARPQDPVWTAALYHSAALSRDQCHALCDLLDVEMPVQGALVPFAVRGSTQALLYADQLAAGPFSLEALQVLTHSAAQALELLPVMVPSPTLRLDAPLGPASELTAPSPRIAALDSSALVTDQEEPGFAFDDAASSGGAPALGVGAETTPEELGFEIEALEAEPEVLYEPPVGAGALAEADEPTALYEEEPELLYEPPAAPASEPAEATQVIPDNLFQWRPQTEPIAPPAPPIPRRGEPFPPLPAPPPPAAAPADETAAFEPDWELAEEPQAPAPGATATPPMPPLPPPLVGDARATQIIRSSDFVPAAPPSAAPRRGGNSTQVMPPVGLTGPGTAFNPRAAADPAHDEAKRLARLLVSEIKLYNEEQIDAGRQRGNIYAVLRDDIDRSRQMYEERVDERVRATSDYFREELIRTLAGGNAQLLGM